MQTESRRRLIRDFKKISEDPPTGIIASPLEDNIMSWQAVIFGPEDTPWEGGYFKIMKQYKYLFKGIFKLTLDFTEDYPNKAPKVRFQTKLFHPNVFQNGDICLDILDNQWSPIFDISAILTSIQSLLCDPNPASPANAEASKLYQEDRKEYMRRVKEMVEQTINEA